MSLNSHTCELEYITLETWLTWVLKKNWRHCAICQDQLQPCWKSDKSILHRYLFRDLFASKLARKKCEQSTHGNCEECNVMGSNWEFWQRKKVRAGKSKRENWFLSTSIIQEKTQKKSSGRTKEWHQGYFHRSFFYSKSNLLSASNVVPRFYIFVSLHSICKISTQLSLLKILAHIVNQYR